MKHVLLALLGLISSAAFSSATPVKRGAIGPAINTSFADPSIIFVDSEKSWFGFSTSGAGKNVQLASSKDFKSWSVESDSNELPKVGAWADNSSPNVWAPMVVQVSNTSFVLYYAAKSIQNGKTGPHCVGAATASNVRGPYTPLDDSIACPVDQGGAIDPAGFQDTDGTRYVAYKVDGNSKGHGGSCGNTVKPIQPTPIMLQKVKDDGHTKDGDPVQILDRDDHDGPLVEAPSLVRVGSTYFLFFSSGCYAETTYDLSYATASKVGGPYTKVQAPDAPLLTTDKSGLTAPGSACASNDGKGIVFHAYLGEVNKSGRGMWTAVPKYDGDKVTISFDLTVVVGGPFGIGVSVS